MKVWSKKKGIFLRLVPLLLASISITTFASDFSLPFINAAELGDVYAGYAASAMDASTAYSNPAGLVRLKCPQLVVAPLYLFGRTRFYGETLTPTFPFPFAVAESGTASSPLAGPFPNFFVSVPLSDRFVFAVQQTVPFGLSTQYSGDSIVRYIATKSKVVVVEGGPSIGVKLTDNLSAGAGVEIENLAFTISRNFGPPVSFPVDSEGKNHLTGYGYGWHAGLLYQFLCARVGVSFQSKVQFHASGDSQLFRRFPPGGDFQNNIQNSSASLPARAQLSLYYNLTPRWAVMATAFYTHWKTLPKIPLDHVLTPIGTIPVSIPLNYKNTVDYSGGVNFKATRRVELRTGFQIMDKPSNDLDRSMADPIGRAFIAGLGMHYQYNCRFSYDVGYAHAFFRDEKINLTSPLTRAVGYCHSQGNLVGIQINWNFV